ncbi:MAG TPA: aminotransferase class I/II-fold pyridoxal phosphate-dependent enzyme [Galbitalea sp.]|nr:aminotransferase class I/II-fold pyridoxal phosphate-dependent enzyme [Galbitalea sp.]
MTSIEQLKQQHADLCAQGLKLDLTRGKPSPEQLDLSNALLALPGEGDYRAADGTDLRNYGGPDGLEELRAIFGELLGIPTGQLLALDAVTLPIMHGTVVNALLNGGPGGDVPWRDVEDVAFLCPVPGYDRHFTICEALGVRMIPVPFVDGGLDLATITKLVASDPSIRGMWAVPMYANPTGYSFTEAEVRALVEMPSAAPDFTLLWDNAYAVHHLTDDEAPVIDVLGLAAAAGHPDRPIVFASTSKITFAGGGVGFVGGSPATVEWIRTYSFARNIGPDKINQLRHVRFLKDAEGVRAHMRENRALLVPKFDAVLEILEARLSGVAEWTRPKGGYFVSLEAGEGCATRAIALAREAGIAVTAAGAPYPYGNDPRDSTIRIAPSFPSIADLRAAIDGLCTCILLAQAERAAA